MALLSHFEVSDLTVISLCGEKGFILLAGLAVTRLRTGCRRRLARATALLLPGNEVLSRYTIDTEVFACRRKVGRLPTGSGNIGNHKSGLPINQSYRPFQSLASCVGVSPMSRNMPSRVPILRSLFPDRKS